jgi:hypothetical protein
MRKVVVEVQCSRCDRKETRDHAEEKEVVPVRNALEVQLWPSAGPSVAVCFEDLCGPCERSVRALLEQIGKRIVGMSPDRPAKAETKDSEPKPVADTKIGTGETGAKSKDAAPHPAPSPRSQPIAPAKSPARSS